MILRFTFEYDTASKYTRTKRKKRQFLYNEAAFFLIVFIITFLSIYKVHFFHQLIRVNLPSISHSIGNCIHMMWDIDEDLTRFRSAGVAVIMYGLVKHQALREL